MRLIAFDLFMLAGWGSITAGCYLAKGLPMALIVGGALMVGLTIFATVVGGSR